MSRIERIVFWTGGTIFPHITQLTSRLVAPPGGMAEKYQIQLHHLERKLSFGSLAPQDYYHALTEMAPLDLSLEQFADQVSRSLELLPGMRDLLLELRERISLIMISDYPREWLIKPVGSLGLTDQIHYSADYSPYPTVIEFYKKLIIGRVIGPRWTLLVDSQPNRARQALKNGFKVAIFVDAKRLRRDLGLWGLYSRSLRQDKEKIG